MAGAPIGDDQRAVILHLEDVYKTYDNRHVLDNIDLSVRQGELCTLVGPSGSGKSTLLKLILGQDQVTSGVLRIGEKPVGYPDRDRGIVYQRYSLFPHLTVLDNVLLGKKLQAGFWRWHQERAVERDEAMHYLERVRLGKHAGKYPHELSGGMQQRVAIVQSLIMKPKILLMDEPFGALDPDTREELQLFLLELWDNQRMTVFFVTHDLEEAMFLGTRILVLSQYYTDDRGTGEQVNRGARIVADHRLPQVISATGAKTSPEFVGLIAQIRQEGFNPEHLQHVNHFNLNHPDSFQTLTVEESSRCSGKNHGCLDR